MATDQAGRTALFVAAHYGHLRTFARLFEHTPATVDFRDITGENAAHAFAGFLARCAAVVGEQRDVIPSAGASPVEETSATTTSSDAHADPGQSAATADTTIDTSQLDADLYAECFSNDEVAYVLHLLVSKKPDALCWKNKQGTTACGLLRALDLDVVMTTLDKASCCPGTWGNGVL
jgi:hypothetical protein